MKVSIIITTYNREKWIIRTLNSIFSQNLSNYEIIIVDNCSTDNTVAVIQKLQNEKIKLYVNNKNYERSYSRNKGIEISTGNYITFLDSDDIYFSNCLVAFNNDYKILGNLDIYAYKVAYVNEKNEIVKNIHYPKSINNLNELLSYGNFLSNIGKFIRKDYAIKYKFMVKSEIIGIEDYEYNLRITNYSNNSILIDKVIAGITIHVDRSTQNEEFEKVRSRSELLMAMVSNEPNNYFQNSKYLNNFLTTMIIFIINQRNSNSKPFFLLIELMKKYKIQLSLKIIISYFRRLISDLLIRVNFIK